MNTHRHDINIVGFVGQSSHPQYVDKLMGDAPTTHAHAVTYKVGGSIYLSDAPNDEHHVHKIMIGDDVLGTTKVLGAAD